MNEEGKLPERRGHSLWAIGFMLLVVLQGVRLDLPDTIVLPAPVTIDEAGMAAGIAVRLSDVVVSVAWN